jgi:hypothetical protein
METARVRVSHALVMLLVLAAGCSKKGLPFPEAIEFGGKGLNKVTAWDRGGMSGVVYVPPGETLPMASLQVGVIISSDHATGSALHTWIADQALRSGDVHAFDSTASEESCRAGASVPEGKAPRTYLTLQVCRTGVARAVCVEADEVLDGGTFTTCLGTDGCFEDVCNERWLARRESLDGLVADMMTVR